MQEVILLHTDIVYSYEGMCSECGEWNYFEITHREGEPNQHGIYVCEYCGYMENIFFGEEN